MLAVYGSAIGASPATLTILSCCGSPLLAVYWTPMGDARLLETAGASGRKGFSAGRAGRQTYTNGEHEGKDKVQTINSEPSAPVRT